MSIKVSLDTSVPPYVVTVKPDPHHVNQGNQTIEWEPDANQNFTFSGLTIPYPQADGSPFGTPQITALKITVTDNNAKAQSYPYQICVTYNVDGKQYCSSAAGIAGGGGGQPSIKND